MVDSASTGGPGSALLAPIAALVGAFGGAWINARLARRNMAAQQEHDRQMAGDRWKREVAERRSAELHRAYTELLSSTGALVPWSFNRIQAQNEDSGYLTAVATVTAALQVVMVVGSAEAATAASVMVQRQNAALKLNFYDDKVHGAYNDARDAYLAVIRREIGQEPQLHAADSLPSGLHY